MKEPASEPGCWQTVVAGVTANNHGGKTVSCPVSLRQVAPTILKSLGLHEEALDAVNLEGTQKLTRGDDDCGGDDEGDDDDDE